MATQAQINANRLNAQYSTGPRTLDGKATASRNALNFGLYAKRDYVRPEEQDFYEHFVRMLGNDLQTTNPLESSLADEIISATWRLRLCNQAEASLGEFDEATDKQRRSIERARAASHSVLHRNLNQLRKLRTERPVKVPYVPDPTLSPAEQAIERIMNAPEPDWNAIDRQIAEKKLASNCKTATPASSQTQNLASICHTGSAATLIASKSASNTIAQGQQIPRNAPCPCRSGEKFKRCCGKTAPPVLGKAA